MSKKIDPITMEYLRKTQELQDKINDLEQERISKLFTLHHVKKKIQKYTEERVHIKWSVENEEITAFYLEKIGDEKTVCVVKYHIDCLSNGHTWNRIDHTNVEEMYFNLEELKDFQALLEFPKGQVGGD